VSHALHVVGINWRNGSTIINDESFVQNLQSLGLQIILDDVPDSWTVHPASMIVMLEMASGLCINVDGDIRVKNNVISWRMKTDNKKAPTNYTNVGITVMPDIGGMVALTEVPNRVRDTFKGRLIWRNCCDRRIYMDCQVFGQPRYELDENGDKVAKCDLVLPRGAGEQASAFESWFYIMLTAKKYPGRQKLRHHLKQKSLRGRGNGEDADRGVSLGNLQPEGGTIMSGISFCRGSHGHPWLNVFEKGDFDHARSGQMQGPLGPAKLHPQEGLRLRDGTADR
jgi:hypothetical protein